jgi:hypothetical protein
MTEETFHYYAYVKDNRVAQVAVFGSQDEELADFVAHLHGYDDAVYLGLNKNGATLYGYYNGTTFEEPTNEYLISIGVMDPPIPVLPLEPEA